MYAPWTPSFSEFCSDVAFRPVDWDFWSKTSESREAQSKNTETTILGFRVQGFRVWGLGV